MVITAIAFSFLETKNCETLTKKITRKIIAADQALNDFHLPAKARERGMSFGNNLSPSAPLPYLHLILPQDLNSMRDFRSARS